MPADADDAAMQALALANPELQAAIAGRSVRKVICVRGRLVNVVA
jgi:leucyl-tRNA synthetase